jgi:NAD(P)H-flavin reductase
MKFLFLTFIPIVLSHYKLTAPPNRGYNDLKEIISPCGDYPVNKTRERIPLKYQLELIAAHSHADVTYTISFSEDPKTQSDFQNITTATVTQLGLLAVGYDFSNLFQARAGAKATIQSLFLGPDGLLHQCADVIFDPTLPPSNFTVSISKGRSGDFEFGTSVYLVVFGLFVLICALYCSSYANFGNRYSSKYLGFYPFWNYSFTAIVGLLLVSLIVLIFWNLDLNNDHQFNRFSHLALYIFAITPFFVFRRTLGYLGFNHQRGMEIHQLLGAIGIALSLIHGFLYLLEWFKADFLYYEFFTVEPHRNIYGAVTAALGLIVLGLSLPITRRYIYRVFYWVHVLTYPAIFVLLYIHTSGLVLAYLVPGLAAYVFEFALRVFMSQNVGISAITQVEGVLTRFTVSGDLRTPEPGQWYIVYSGSTWHPLSIIDHLGNFSFAVNDGNMGRNLKIGDQLSVDGPFGNSFANIFDFNACLLVAGGIGITPLLSIINHLTDQEDCAVHLIWIIKDHSIHESFVKELKETTQKGVCIQLYHTGQMMETQKFSKLYPEINSGRPRFEEIIDDFQVNNPKKQLSCAVCGPESLIVDVSNICRSGRNAIPVFSESF